MKNQNMAGFFYTQTTSTNDRAKEHFPLKKSPCLFVTTHQTQGRGTKNKTWLNSDMMLSWVWQTEKAPQPVTIEIMAKALREALKHTWPEATLISPKNPVNKNFYIKPPNDIYIAGKKLAGLLTEVISKDPQHLLVVGVGMNVFSHPPPFTHLQKHLKKHITQEQWFCFMSTWYRELQKKLPFCFLS